MTRPTTDERLSVKTIRATLEDMKRHGLRGGLPQEEAFALLAEIDRLREIADQKIFARMLAATHMQLNEVVPALRTIIEQHDKDGCIAAGAFDRGRDALTALESTNDK
jgi:hypothetical protein